MNSTTTSRGQQAITEQAVSCNNQALPAGETNDLVLRFSLSWWPWNYHFGRGKHWNFQNYTGQPGRYRHRYQRSEPGRRDNAHFVLQLPFPRDSPLLLWPVEKTGPQQSHCRTISLILQFSVLVYAWEYLQIHLSTSSTTW